MSKFESSKLSPDLNCYLCWIFRKYRPKNLLKNPGKGKISTGSHHQHKGSSIGIIEILLSSCMKEISGGCFWHYLCKTIYLRSRKVALLEYLLKCALHLSWKRIKCYYNQRNTVESDRENVVPRNLIMIWSLIKRDHWKKNYYGHVLMALKLLKLKKNSTTALQLLKFLNLKKTPSLS